MQALKKVAQTKIAVAALSAVLSVVGTAVVAHYPQVYAAVCSGGGM